MSLKFYSGQTLSECVDKIVTHFDAKHDLAEKNLDDLVHRFEVLLFLIFLISMTALALGIAAFVRTI